MSTIKATNNVGIYKIQKFLGLNENPNGDQLLELGEASECKNWKVTRDFNLKRRPGTHTMFTLSLHEPVRGMWYGNINGVPTGLAACDGHLWKFYEDEGYLSVPVDLGEFDTSRRVNFFAYSDIVYILNGDEYMQYDGVSFKAVTGYVPIVAISRTPNGSASTLLEEVNKLNNMRKVWFSPDGEDNVFLLPEKDILSVHYVKNLGTGEYINPSTYNVDRINGRVTFGKDINIEYEEGVTSYEITDEELEDIGSIEINGAVPQATYLPDHSGVVFDEAPAYGKTITLTSGENFTEEFTGDGETAVFTFENKNMNEYNVSVDGVEMHPEGLYENNYHDGMTSTLSSIDFKYTIDLNSMIKIVTEEDGEFTKTLQFSAGNDNKPYALPEYFDGELPDKVTVQYNATHEELPEITDPSVVICPYPENLTIDKDAFREAYKKSSYSKGVQPLDTLGYKTAYFFYDKELDKWHPTYSYRVAMGGTKISSAITTGSTFTYTAYTLQPDGYGIQPMVWLENTDPVNHIAMIGNPIVLFNHKDFEYTLTPVVVPSPETGRVVISITLEKDVAEYFREIYGEDPVAVNVYISEYNRLDLNGEPYNPDYEPWVDLEDFGMTYTPEASPETGDLVLLTFNRNFTYDGTNFYAIPNGSPVATTTKFDVTLHAYRTATTERLYGPWSSVAYSNAITNMGVTTIAGLTAVSQKSLEVIINGKRYYESGDYSNTGNVITFVDAPAEGAIIHVDEVLSDGVTKVIAADGQTTVFNIGYIGAETIDVSVDSVDVGLDTRFTFDAETRTITILDTDGMVAGDLITIKGSNPPSRGINTIEICYSAGMAFTQTVNKMTNAEIFLGTQDNAVFLYGDGSNKAFYSGIDYNGKPRADYFPDLNEMTVADSNTPITGMIRHFSQLICFKSKSVYTIHYGQITTATGNNEYAFYITPVNKEIGNAALGQVRLVLNSPYALYANDLYEWKSNSRYSSNLSQDERSAHRISDRIYATLATFNAEDCYCYDDNPGQEYYIWYQDKALVFNYAANAWYMYQGLNVSAMCNLEGDLLVGTADGKIKIMSEDYTNDDGDAFDSYWESGSMDFGSDYMRKLMSEVWISVKPDKNYSVNLTASTDRKVDFTEKTLSGEESDKDTPMVKKLKMKAKKFAYLKLILQTNDPDNGATILSLDPKVRETGYAK